MADVETRTYPIEQLRTFSERVFRHFDIPEADARLAAEVLPLPTGAASTPTASPACRRTSRCSPPGASTHARRCRWCASRPAPRRSTATTVWGSSSERWRRPRPSAPAGSAPATPTTSASRAIGYYVLKALERALSGLAMTNATKLVPPLWGAERMLGTTPLAIAFPGDEEPPIVIDMATSAVAYGKVEIARREQAELPEGWAIDRAGRPTTDPQAMIGGGAPLGSDYERGGHKGYCLATMVDVLTSVLSGANWGPFAPPFALRQGMPERSVGKGIGHVFGAWRIDGFIAPSEFKRQIDGWICVFRAPKPAPGAGGPLMPGEAGACGGGHSASAPCRGGPA